MKLMVFSTVAFSMLASQVTLADIANSSAPVPTSTYTVPGAFPTSLYGEYYNSPTGTSAQVQPVITDPIAVSAVSVDFLLKLLSGIH